MNEHCLSQFTYTCPCSVTSSVAQHHLPICMCKVNSECVCVYFRDTCAEVLLEDDGDDQSLPAAILDALMKVHVHNMGVYAC